ncbi:hypothetical protein [Parafrankia sp. FMc2]|uniref:hypothetical protein n=1 Tax=Parafrankia sp. FMc2 TaxID=3233196 RepID=UPI0034D6278D
MARFNTATVGALAVMAGMAAGSADPPQPAWVLLVGMITFVVLGVNITAWLVVPRVIGSAFAATPPLPAEPGSYGRDRDTDWSSSSEWQPEAWSSSWDYAGSDSADGSEGADDDWPAHRGSRYRRDRDTGPGPATGPTTGPFGFSWNSGHGPTAGDHRAAGDNWSATPGSAPGAADSV